ncbi:glycosyltransferase involved in cell wall biosynthesis [Bacillus fengqiuensis]|nr:glycosyltransferase involved in cell wall biosynthesis [Bacillus fengqiuensis]
MEKLSVILPVMNEADKIATIIQELKKLRPFEIIAVVNGSNDRTSQIAQTMGARVIEYKEPLGHNIGRAIGAYHATGDILLFLDGDFIIRSEHLLPFVNAIRSGHDLAVNNLSPIMKSKNIPHTVSVAKAVINELSDRKDLSINSLVAVPHAISRQGVQKIGWQHLADPPLAQTIALHLNLSIVSPKYVDVISPNKIRANNHFQIEKGSPYPKSTSRIIGDHLTAIHYLGQELGSRGGYADGQDKDLLQSIEIHKTKQNTKRSIVITAEKKASHLPNTIQALKNKLKAEIIVILHDPDKEFTTRLINAGARIVPLLKPADSYTMRAVGAAYSSGEMILFIDGHSSILPNKLQPFFKEIEKGADICLNDASNLLKKPPIDSIQFLQYFLNITMKKPDLLNSSLTDTPHAIHRRVLNKIGWQSLAIPPLAYVYTITGGFKIEVCQCINREAVTLNHAQKERLYGDHLEALLYYLSITNKRGGFTVGSKNYDVLEELKNQDNQLGM